MASYYTSYLYNCGDEHECQCSECGSPGNSNCDWELSNPCSNCLCKACSSRFDDEWLGALRTQKKRAQALLKTDAGKEFPKGKKMLVSSEDALTGWEAFLPKIEGGQFAFEEHAERHDFEASLNRIVECELAGTLPPHHYFYSVTFDDNGSILSLVSSKGMSLLSQRAGRIQMLRDFQSVHKDAGEEWKALFKRFVRNGKLSSRFEYIQLIAGEVLKECDVWDIVKCHISEGAPEEIGLVSKVDGDSVTVSIFCTERQCSQKKQFKVVTEHAIRRNQIIEFVKEKEARDYLRKFLSGRLLSIIDDDSATNNETVARFVALVKANIDEIVSTSEYSVGRIFDDIKWYAEKGIKWYAEKEKERIIPYHEFWPTIIKNLLKGCKRAKHFKRLFASLDDGSVKPDGGNNRERDDESERRKPKKPKVS